MKPSSQHFSWQSSSCDCAVRGPGTDSKSMDEVQRAACCAVVPRACIPRDRHDVPPARVTADIPSG